MFRSGPESTPFLGSCGPWCCENGVPSPAPQHRLTTHPTKAVSLSEFTVVQKDPELMVGLAAVSPGVPAPTS